MLETSQEELLAIRNFGEKSLSEARRGPGRQGPVGRSKAEEEAEPAEEQDETVSEGEEETAEQPEEEEQPPQEEEDEE